MISWPHISDLEPGVIYTEFVWLDGNMLVVHILVDAIASDAGKRNRIVYGRELHIFDEGLGEECTSLYFTRRANVAGVVDKCIECTPGPKFYSHEAAITWFTGVQ